MRDVRMKVMEKKALDGAGGGGICTSLHRASSYETAPSDSVPTEPHGIGIQIGGGAGGGDHIQDT